MKTMGKYFKTMDVKGFLIEIVATGDQAEMIRKVLDKFKGSTFDYVIQFLTFGWSGNVNNTGRMQKVVVPKNGQCDKLMRRTSRKSQID